MVHSFRCLDNYFMLDVESGSVFEIDELTHKVIGSRNSPLEQSIGEFCHADENATADCSNIVRADKQLQEQIDEINAEIDALIAEKTLFTDTLEYPKPHYSGIVKALCLNICHNCNLACEYCFADGGSYHGDVMSMPFSTAKLAVDFLIARSGSRKNLEIDFFGGEPLLNLDVVKLTVDYARSLELANNKKFKFTITTNAVSLDEDAINFFNREMSNVVISIDGRDFVHNRVRKTKNGKDSFSIALQNALNFRKVRGDKSYYIRGTFTALNLDFASDVLAINDYGFDQISIEPVVLPDGHPLAITPEHIPQLIAEYENLTAEYIKRRKSPDKWFNFFHFMLDLFHAPCESKRLVGCGAGNEYLAITPNGDIFPCHQFAGNLAYKVGNIVEQTFSDSIPLVFAKTNLTTKDSCNSCWAKFYCSGGCCANSVNFYNDINKTYKISCELMKKRIECSIAINVLENKVTKTR